MCRKGEYLQQQGMLQTAAAHAVERRHSATSSSGCTPACQHDSQVTHTGATQRATTIDTSPNQLWLCFVACAFGLQVLAWVQEGKDVRLGDWSAREIEILNSWQLLTAKPVVYLVNLSPKVGSRASECCGRFSVAVSDPVACCRSLAALLQHDGSNSPNNCEIVLTCELCAAAVCWPAGLHPQEEQVADQDPRVGAGKRRRPHHPILWRIRE